MDSDGIRVVEYTYDAWGKILSISGSMKDTLGQANPLRYRGYVYDDETGLYYLQSRYYDPQTRRFLNSDIVYDTDAGLQGYNLFIYCGNNPKNRIDASGFDSEESSKVYDSTPEDEALILGPGAKGGTGYGGSSAWDSFRLSMRDAAEGLSRASGERNAFSFENHHFLSNKSKTYTSEFQAITDNYGLSLNGTWNTAYMEGHRGRHTNAYHDFMLEQLEAIDAIAQGNYDDFIYGFSILKQFVIENNWLPYARR